MAYIYVYNTDSPKSKPCYAESGTELKPMVPLLSKIEAMQQPVQAVPSAPPLSGGKSPTGRTTLFAAIAIVPRNNHYSVHLRKGKVIGDSIVVVMDTKITKSRKTGIVRSALCHQTVKNHKKLSHVYFKSLRTAHEHYKSRIFINHAY